MTEVSSGSVGTPKWQTLPDTPRLPTGGQEGVVEIAGAKIWYKVYGSGPPVILLHGGLGNSDYWGLQVAALAATCQVIVMDSRGHGRSSRGGGTMSYVLMKNDVMALIDHCNLPKAAIVGWSDGAIIGLLLAMQHPDRISGVFCFGANSGPNGTFDLTNNAMFNRYIKRTEEEYARLSPTPDGFGEFLGEMNTMWITQPDFTVADLKGIQVPVWVVDGDHEEVIRREDTLFIADTIPNSGLSIQPEVSHFSVLQDPDQFTADIRRFLRAKGIV
ncbi:MAG TPA: alpha/beta hydrolase [Ensifer sp.]|jgi:pimeloyl-ACP methyl ester carboxylesterase|uniref:alpha/beta fold hydrolase n=1 Tax=Ensifer sp. TaxID=1872086 RepID=UPI002E151BB4|nr:alpha/beta hydrolase [Ensifer sp.]